MVHEIRFAITLTPKMARFLLITGLVTAVPLQLGSETMTMTATYPSPVGIYRSLITTGGTSVNGANTLLARDAGKVGVGTANPNAKLDVNGDINSSGNISAGGSVTAAHLQVTGGSPQPFYAIVAQDSAGNATWGLPYAVYQ